MSKALPQMDFDTMAIAAEYWGLSVSWYQRFFWTRKRLRKAIGSAIRCHGSLVGTDEHIANVLKRACVGIHSVIVTTPEAGKVSVHLNHKWWAFFWARKNKRLAASADIYPAGIRVQVTSWNHERPSEGASSVNP